MLSQRLSNAVRCASALLALTLLLLWAGAPNASEAATNLVQNPGFESGSLSPWGKWNDASVVSNNQHTGSYALRLGNAQASSEQVVSGLSPNTTYVLTGWAKLASGSTGEIRIGVKEYDGTGTQIQRPVTADSYTQETATFTTGASNTSAKIFCYRNTGSGYAYCDDFSLVAEGGGGGIVSPGNTTYYVDCSAGSDGDGSQSSPWNTLATVNDSTFAAGDEILFKRGTTCAGTLWPKGSGASGNPIVVDTYGTGAQPHIQATCADNGIYLFNQAYWELRNLEVSNDCGTVSNARRGVHVHLEDFGTGSYYRILNLTVHNVRGDPNTDSPKNTGGIIFRVTGSGVQTKFSDVIIEGNTLYTVDRSGINMGTSWWCRPEANCSGTPNYVAWDPFIVRNNTLYDVGGDGIVLQYASGSTVEYNVVHDAQARSTRCNAGIWPWNADDVVFQYNEAYNVRLTNTSCDGQGFDIDYGTARTVMQYNYSHDNEGGFMLICGPNSNGNVDSVVRYNVSQNDKKHIFHVTGAAVTNAQVYNNTIYVASGNGGRVVEEGAWGGSVHSAYFTNNLFYHLGSGGYSLTSGNITFDHNVFYGNHPASEPADAHKITADPLLVNPGSGGTGLGTVGGYQLQAGSPAICAGAIIASNGGQDYWGNAVPSDRAPDIGAHQLSTSCETGGGDLPSPWLNQDVGGVAAAGSATYDGGTFTIEGSGADIWGTADEFHYVYQALEGDGEIVARVASVENTNAWAKAGVMIRETLNDSAKHAMVVVTPGNGVAFQRRTSTGGSSSHTGSSGSAPHWVKLVRSGDTFTAYKSTDGAAWTQIGSASISMASNVYVGLAVTAHNDGALCTSALDNVSVSGSAPPPTNLAGNPGFETGSASPWSAWGGAAVVNNNARSGSYAGRTCASNCGFEQIVTGLSPNTTYVLTGWARVVNAGETVSVGVKDFGAAQISDPINATSYTQGTVTFTTGASNTSAKIYCYKWSGGSGYAYCDDFTLVEQ